MNQETEQEKKYREECSRLSIPNQSVYDNYEWFYIAGRKAGQEDIPKVIQCPYCEHEASNQMACDIYGENKRLKDLATRAKPFTGHKHDCTSRIDGCSCGFKQWLADYDKEIGG